MNIYSTGAIPRTSSKVTNAGKAKKNREIMPNGQWRMILDGQVYEKTKVEGLDRVTYPLCNSGMAKKFHQATVKNNKQFVEQAAEGTSERETKKLNNLQNVEDSSLKKTAEHQSVKQLIIEYATADAKVTPHMVTLPQPENVKVSRLVPTEQEDTRNSHDAENYIGHDISYLNDFVLYQQEKDQRREFGDNYRQRNISAAYRRAVVKFVHEISYYNNLPSDLVYQTVRIFDDMLQAKPIMTKNIKLVMIAALWISCKKDLNPHRQLSASQMAQFSEGLYSPKEIVRCELDIVKTLSFAFIYPEPVSLLWACMLSVKERSAIGQENMNEIYHCGCYMIDVATIDEELITYSAILLAATAAELAMTVVAENEDNLCWGVTPFIRWRSQQGFLLVEEEDIVFVRNLLIRDINESCHPTSSAYILYKKYCRSGYGKVAAMLTRKIHKLRPPE